MNSNTLIFYPLAANNLDESSLKTIAKHHSFYPNSDNNLIYFCYSILCLKFIT